MTGQKASIYDLFMYLNVRLIVEFSCVVPAEEVQVFEHLLNCSVQHATA